jgi:hypothetical protein
MGNRKNLPQYATQSPALGLTLVKKDFTEKSLRGLNPPLNTIFSFIDKTCRERQQLLRHPSLYNLQTTGIE